MSATLHTSTYRKLHWFVDESGDFFSPGYHAIAIVGHLVPDTSLDQDVTAIFSAHGHDIKTFHATSLDVSARSDLIHALAASCSHRVIIYTAWIHTKQASDYCFYFPVLAKSIEHVTRMWRAHPLDQLWPLPVEVHLEHRSGFSNNLLSEYLHKVARTPDESNLIFTFLNLPKGSSPMLQIADVAANLTRAHYTQASCPLPDWFQTISIPASYVEGGTARKVHMALTEGIIEKEVVRHTVEERISVVHDNRSLALALSTELQDKLAKHHLSSSEDKAVCYDAMVKRLDQLCEADWYHEIEKLIQIADDAAKTRMHTYAIVLAELALQSLDCGRASQSVQESVVRRLRITAACRWLAAHNHLGLFAAEAPLILEAEDTARLLQSDPAAWPALADFYNCISVAFQNQLDFQEAIQRVRPSVVFFEQQRQTPFGTATMSGNSIAALYASYAQSLFFAAHQQYFTTKGVTLRQHTDDAMMYSEYSESLFDNDTDRARQPVYRAHGLMQLYILTGDKDALAQAGDLLLALGDTRALITAFCDDPLGLDGNALYRFAAVLKHAWLSKTRIADLPENKSMGKLMGQLPACHPYEHILGYFALLDICSEIAARLLAEYRWPSPLVSCIAICFRMQIAWQPARSIPAELRRELERCMDTNLRNKWQEYGIWSALDCIASSSYAGLGPLTLLPFNYS